MNVRIQRLTRQQWLRRPLALALVLVLVGVNGIAYMQAYSMTHYAPQGMRTGRPEDLTFFTKVGTILTGITVPRPQNDNSPADLNIPYETYMIDVDQPEFIEAWYIPATGAHSLVLLFPGYAESKESLLPAARAFHEAGYDALLVDFRGAGGSSGNDTTLGVREAKDVAFSVGYAQRTWPGRSTILYGVSMGAASVLRAIAAEGIKPDAVILESPFDTMLGTVGNRFQAMGLPAFPFAELLVFWGSVQQGFNGFAHNPSEYAASVQCPVLLMHGELDPRVTAKQAEAIYSSLAGPKQIVTFRGAGHETLIVDDAQLWEATVSGFLVGQIKERRAR